MLDKLSRKILKHMQTETPSPSNTCYNFDEDLDAIASAVSTDVQSARSAVEYLQKQGYIEFMYFNNLDITSYFCLDHKGLHYREFVWIARKEFLMKSILTPIIVTILTTISINNLWPIIWHWLIVKLSGTQ